MARERLAAGRLPLAIGGRDGVDQRLLVVRRGVERPSDPSSEVVDHLVAEGPGEVGDVGRRAAERRCARLGSGAQLVRRDFGIAGDVVRGCRHQLVERWRALGPAQRVEHLVLLIGQRPLQCARQRPLGRLERRVALLERRVTGNLRLGLRLRLDVRFDVRFCFQGKDR